MSFFGNQELVLQIPLAAIRPVRADGNCLFGAISDQLYGTQERHDEIRDAVV